MTDYSAHDIHRLDQAYPDALADIEAHIGDPNQKAALADKGTEVYAAELTRELADTATSPMSLAAWAAIATVRLMEAGRAWEEDTDAAWAKVAELTAERDEWRERYELAHADRLARSLERDRTIDEREYLKAQLTAANRRADGLEADLRSAVKGNTAWANQEAAKDAEAADRQCQHGYPQGGAEPNVEWCQLRAGHAGLHKGNSHPIGFTDAGTVKRSAETTEATR